jgi:FkbM family methyltransferase
MGMETLLKEAARRVVKKLLARFDIKVVRFSKSPMETLLGLKSMPIGSFIDIGANEGSFSRLIRESFPNASLYCFEPLSEPFEKLRLWAAQCGNRQIALFNIALGDRKETVDLFHHVQHHSSSSLLESTDHCRTIYPFTDQQVRVPVQVDTLDHLMQDESVILPAETVIKMDVQGYEDRVIRGGRETFAKAKAVILEVCLDPLYERQANFKEIMMLLDDLGFNYAGNLDQNYDKDGHVIFLDAVFVK